MTEQPPLPRPPWPADHRCQIEGCGHVIARHAEPILEDGHCTVAGCPCRRWDPLTPDQWRRAMDALHRTAAQ